MLTLKARFLWLVHSKGGFSVFINVSGFVHLKYSDSRTFVHIGKSTNIYLDEKYPLQIPDSNSPKRIWYKNVSDSCRNLLFVYLAFKAQPVSMLLPSPSAF